MGSVSDVFLKDVAAGELVAAQLYDQILARHLQDHVQSWKPMTAKLAEQHGHWDWGKKWAYFSQQLSYQSFAIECEGQTQGLMIVNTIARCKLASQANQHLVYVEYLEAAPWNRSLIVATPKYKLVGVVMIAAAIQLSRDEGYKGRIGLHSLPQADSFYRDRCQMSDLGRDAAKQNLTYFEMTDAQADQFLNGR